MVVKRMCLITVEVSRIVQFVGTSPFGKVTIKKEHSRLGRIMFPPVGCENLCFQVGKEFNCLSSDGCVWSCLV